MCATRCAPQLLPVAGGPITAADPSCHRKIEHGVARQDLQEVERPVDGREGVGIGECFTQRRAVARERPRVSGPERLQQFGAVVELIQLSQQLEIVPPARVAIRQTLDRH